MYKVFFNDRIVFIAPRGVFIVSENIYRVKVSNYFEFENACNHFFHFGQHSDLFIEVVQAELIDSLIQQYFIIIEAAGGLVYNQSGKLLAIKRLGVWDLPKGKIEKNESRSEAAIREVEEETGIHNLTIVSFKAVSYHVYKSKHHNNKLVLKPTYWYVMKYSGDEIPTPQTSEQITEVKWCDAKQIIDQTYASLVNLLT